jgi:regulator of replication initiation timing
VLQKVTLYVTSLLFLVSATEFAVIRVLSGKLRSCRKEVSELKQKAMELASANELLSRRNDQLSRDLSGISSSYSELQARCNKTIQEITSRMRLKPKPTVVKEGKRYDPIDCASDPICSTLNSMFKTGTNR